ncbi:MAG: hypothetical protein DMG57_18245 [Acidobacteria bacterium]|nr:MAG: hypothetical protein DMG57_18245 [Acidobacteriota bacterium]
MRASRGADSHLGLATDNAGDVDRTRKRERVGGGHETAGFHYVNIQNVCGLRARKFIGVA